MRTDYHKFPAGRELDQIVAEKIMGWIWVYRPPEVPEFSNVDGMPTGNSAYLISPDLPKEKQTWGYAFLSKDIPHYSTDISSAWEIAEKLRLSVAPFVDGKKWISECPLKAIGLGNNPTLAIAETAPLAICRAALLSKYIK